MIIERMEDLNISQQEELQILQTSEYLQQMIKNYNNPKIIFDFSNYYPSFFSDEELTNLMHDANKSIGTRIIEAETLRKQHPNDRWINVVLMRLYFSIRKQDLSYYRKSTEFARLAVICGHNEGEAERRLAINLTREKKYYQVVELCKVLLGDERIMWLLGKDNVVYFEKKFKTNERRLAKALDKPECKLFSNDELDRWKNAIGLENIDVSISEEDRANAFFLRMFSTKDDGNIHVM